MSFFRITVLCCALLTVLISTVISLNPRSCQECVKRNHCHPPACSCCNDNMPIITRNNTPQMVFFTFDDAITPSVAEFYRKLFDSSRTNPNGCPVKMTLFVSHANTVYSLVKEFYDKGMEIGAHSVSHAHMNKHTFKSEAKKQKENIARMAHIPISEIKGWRSPFLEPIGDAQPKALKELDYIYDATLTIGKKGLKKPPIPFTLDYGWPYDCKIKPCPTSSHNGFWEVPVISVLDHLEKFDCVYVDGCNLPPPNEEAAFKFLWDNFNTYYRGNRAPFGMNMHASWFYYPDRLRAMDRFIKVLNNLSDVYIVSVSQVIDWLKRPTSLSDIHYFKPWGCKKPRVTSRHRIYNPRHSSRSHALNGISRNSLIHQQLEKRRKLRIEQARIDFIKRQKERQRQQHQLFKQHGLKNKLQPGLTQQNDAQIPFNTGTLGRRQFMWLQRQKAKQTFNRKGKQQKSKFPSSNMSWQKTLRHQVMRQMKNNVRSATPSTLSQRRAYKSLQQNKRMSFTKTHNLQDLDKTHERPKQHKEKEQRRSKAQLEAERKVVKEERRIVERKRLEEAFKRNKDGAILTKNIKPKNEKSYGETRIEHLPKSKVESWKGFAKSMLSPHLPLLLGSQNPGMVKLAKIKPGNQIRYSELNQEGPLHDQNIKVTTVSPNKKITTFTTKKKTFPSAKLEINSHNLFMDSFQDAVGKNKKLWTWSSPTKSYNLKKESARTTLPPIKVATTGGFIDYSQDTISQTKQSKITPKLTFSPSQQFKENGLTDVTVTTHSPDNPEPVNDMKTTKQRLSLREESVTKTPTAGETCQQEVTCFEPDCLCLSHNSPGNITTSEIPQMIYLTIDGDVNFSAFSKMRSLFSRQRKNPNGCHIGGTMFVSPDTSSIRLVNLLHKDNIEIAVLGSKSHGFTNGIQFASDIERYEKKLSKETAILASDVKGYRGLDFQPLNDDEMKILQNKTMYDSSLISTEKIWPFTLDYGWTGSCKYTKCPTENYSAVWEIPIIPLTNSKIKDTCNYADGCKSQPVSKQDTFDYLLENFNRHHSSTRSPFGIHLRQKWFHWYYHHNLAGLSKFIDYVLLMKNVYIVSISDMINWMKEPTALENLKNFKPWQC